MIRIGSIANASSLENVLEKEQKLQRRRFENMKYTQPHLNARKL